MPLGFKTIIKPSKKAMQRHYQKVKGTIETHSFSPQALLIGQLNKVIRGWTAYYSTVSSNGTFSRLAHLTFVKLRHWAKRRHPSKSWKRTAEKYWRLEQGVWRFSPPDGWALYRHFKTPIKPHVKVRGNKSPYDGDWVYWAPRRAKHPGIPTRVANLLKQQAGKCALCGLYFSSWNLLEVDHIIPKSQGGRDRYDNWQLLHRHCHHKKTAKDKKLQQLEALMTSASHVRSRMSGNAQVRFGAPRGA